jgi:hypothetical protein
MIGKQEAMFIAQKLLDDDDDQRIGYKIVEETIEETDLLWILFFTIGTGYKSDGKEIKLRGNSPFAIEKFSGKVHRLPTGSPTSRSVPELEEIIRSNATKEEN